MKLSDKKAHYLKEAEDLKNAIKKMFDLEQIETSDFTYLTNFNRPEVNTVIYISYRLV